MIKAVFYGQGQMGATKITERGYKSSKKQQVIKMSSHLTGECIPNDVQTE